MSSKDLRFEARKIQEEDAVRELLADMRRQGCDLRVPRRVEFFSTFEPQEAALAAGQALASAGYPSTVYRDREEGNYFVVSHRQMTLSENALLSAQGEVEALVERFGGEFDGLETDHLPLLWWRMPGHLLARLLGRLLRFGRK